MIRSILIWPDPRLNQKSVEVPRDNIVAGGIKDLIRDMWDTTYKVGGLGLAAIQIGVALRVLVMDVYDNVKRIARPVVMVNPVIQALEGVKDHRNEGCLSVPGVVERVERWDNCRVKYLDETGEEQERVFMGLESQCLQHEVEHLDGILLPDKFSGLIRERIKKQVAAHLKGKR